MIRPLVIALLGVATLATPSASARTVGWRGDGTGRFPEAKPPTRWSPTTNVRWKTPMKSWGNASPIVVGDHVYVTAEPNRLLCLNASNGRVLWDQATDVSDGLPAEEAERVRPLVAEAAQAEAELSTQLQEISRLSREVRKKDAGAAARTNLDAAVARANTLKLTIEKAAQYRTAMTNDTIGIASATPVSDGQAVYVLYGNGVVTSFDASGHRRWARWLGPPVRTGMNGYSVGHAASPLLVAGKLIVPWDQLTALNPADGAILWKTVKYRDAGTPVSARLDGKDVIVTPAGGVLSVEDGQPRAEHIGQVYYDGPIVSDGTAYFVGSADVVELLQHGHSAARAVRLADTKQPLWDTPLRKDYFMASPVVQDGLLYALSEEGVLSALDLRTGAVVYEQPLGGNKGTIAYPSLSIGGDLLFATTDDGVTRVIRPGRTFQQIGENKLEPMRSSFFFSGDRLYARTLNAVYCLQKGK